MNPDMREGGRRVKDTDMAGTLYPLGLRMMAYGMIPRVRSGRKTTALLELKSSLEDVNFVLQNSTALLLLNPA
jgi:hypothetical protein